MSKISEVTKKEAFAATDSVPIGAANSNAALRVTGDQIKAFCNESEGTATTATLNTIRVKLSNGTYGEISKNDLANAIGEVLGLQNNVLKTKSSPSDADAFRNEMQGMSSVSVTSSTNNVPGSGILVQMQRANGASVTTSQVIGQMLFNSMRTYVRTGVGDGSGVVYNDWLELLTGKTGNIATGSDLDDYVDNGFYKLGGTTQTNLPVTSSQYGVLCVFGEGIESEGKRYLVQFYCQVTTGAIYVRTRTGSTWSAWTHINFGYQSLTDLTNAVNVNSYNHLNERNDITDLDNENGVVNSTVAFFCAPSTSPDNAPISSTRFALTIQSFGTYDVVQTFYDRNSKAVYTRRKAGGWGSWSRVDSFGYSTLSELSVGLLTNSYGKVLTQGSDMNSITTEGRYLAYTTYLSNISHKPNGATYGFIEVKHFDNVRILQTWWNYDGSMFRRITENGGTSWGKWGEFASTKQDV